MATSTYINILMAKMWEFGHSFAEIRAMPIEDMGIILGYWHEKGRVEAKRQRVQKRKNNRRGG